MAILAAVGDELVPLMEIARGAGYDITKRATQQSFRRALEGLYGKVHEVGYQWVRYPGCVGGLEPCVRRYSPDGHDLDTTDAVRRIEALYPERTRAVSEAEFMMEQIRSGRWTVCDNGKPVDPHAQWLVSPTARSR